MIAIRDERGEGTFAVRVHPRAARTAITGSVGEALKISLAAPAVEGRANRELIEFLAEVFDVPRSAILILTGANARNKIVRITGRSASEISQALGKHFPV